MSALGQEPAFPLAVTNANGQTQFDIGCTKRELFAALAMQGFITRGIGNGDPELRARLAVMHADALIAALAKTEGAS